jgi:MarR family transcriptional regulator, organic hydroperoxide resistance regulator
MEKLKLVRRQRNADDRRKINVFLTPLGKRMGKKTVEHMHEVNERIALGFTKHDIETLRALLRHAHDNLTRPA